MADVKISAEVRKEFGKGASRRIRAAGKVPGVIYGHGREPLHVTLPGHEMLMALKSANVLITLDVEGREELVIPKQVQREALRGFLVHVDLLVVEKGEKVTVEVPLVTEGELAPGAGMVEHIMATLSVETEATHIPESITVSVAGLEGGTSVLAKDIALPKGTSLAVDPEEIVLQVVQPQAEEAPAEAAEGAGEGQAPAGETPAE
jgi:large subunit ribosomal protein L25